MFFPQLTEQGRRAQSGGSGYHYNNGGGYNSGYGGSSYGGGSYGSSRSGG
eukprot:m.155185 g.155185  ORF g.155185 m.155185 type:complete len:50 (+) comp17523_c0_seq6:918-1067(+)